LLMLWPDPLCATTVSVAKVMFPRAGSCFRGQGLVRAEKILFLWGRSCFCGQDLHGVSDTDTVKALMTAYEGLLNNPKFTNPPVDLATYKAGIDQYSALIIDAEDGGKKAKAAMNKQRVVVLKMYTLLGHYVETACNDDLATFSTSGFPQAAARTKTAPAPLTEAKFSWIDRGPNSGDVVVQPEKQTGAIAFDVRYALQGAGGVLGSWTTITITKPKKVTITGLTLAGIYQFQIRALGVLGYTDWMDTKTFVVA
jgi:hypothetical protein